MRLCISGVLTGGNLMKTITETARLTNLPFTFIKNLIFEGKIELVDGKITDTTVKQLVMERSNYISFREYAIAHSSEKFQGNLIGPRNNLLQYIEDHNYFEVTIIEPSRLVIGIELDVFYFDRKFVAVFDENLKEFFEYYGCPEREKILQMLNGAKGRKTTKKYIVYYMDNVLETITPAFTAVVKVLLSVPDVSIMTNADVQKMFSTDLSVTSRSHLAKFLKFTKNMCATKYADIISKQKESHGLPAYSDEVYLVLAKCFFNAQHIFEHQMIEKALQKPKYGEMWLYLTVFYACGWRAQDVCNGWKYLRLYEREDSMFGINKDTLADDILADKIPDETYENVCKYALNSIDQYAKLPSKTSMKNPNALIACITPALYVFYGLLTLIAEANMLRYGKGYMDSKRCAEYQNKMNLKAFFGQELWDVLEGKNIHTRRLNKDYLQGVEKTAREKGCGGVLASAVASYARNHTNLDTIRIYLRDHNLTGETADVVLYFMMERGVFGFEFYQTLVTAYPDAMRKLSLKDQNVIIKKLGEMTALETEQIESGIVTQRNIQDDFMSGNEFSVVMMLKSMFEISQMRAKGKENGIYCLLRATKMACVHPDWESCLANNCPHLVFTQFGYIPLLSILAEYQKKSKAGDIKAENVLQQVLIPRYQSILNRFMHETHMHKNDRMQLVHIMEGYLT